MSSVIFHLYEGNICIMFRSGASFIAAWWVLGAKPLKRWKFLFHLNQAYIRYIRLIREH